MNTLTLTPEMTILVRIAVEHYARDVQEKQATRAQALRDKGAHTAADYAAYKSVAVSEQAGLVKLAIDCATACEMGGVL